MEPSTAIYRRFQAEAPGRENRLLFFRMRTQPRVTPLLERMDCPSRPSVDIVLSKCRPRRCGAVVQARTGSTPRLSSKKKKTQIFLSSLLRCCALLKRRTKVLSFDVWWYRRVDTSTRRRTLVPSRVAPKVRRLVSGCVADTAHRLFSHLSGGARGVVSASRFLRNTKYK